MSYCPFCMKKITGNSSKDHLLSKQLFERPPPRPTYIRMPMHAKCNNHFKNDLDQKVFWATELVQNQFSPATLNHLARNHKLSKISQGQMARRVLSISKRGRAESSILSKGEVATYVSSIVTGILLRAKINFSRQALVMNPGFVVASEPTAYFTAVSFNGCMLRRDYRHQGDYFWSHFQLSKSGEFVYLLKKDKCSFFANGELLTGNWSITP